MGTALQGSACDSMLGVAASPRGSPKTLTHFLTHRRKKQTTAQKSTHWSFAFVPLLCAKDNQSIHYITIIVQFRSAHHTDITIFDDDEPNVWWPIVGNTLCV